MGPMVLDHLQRTRANSVLRMADRSSSGASGFMNAACTPNSMALADRDPPTAPEIGTIFTVRQGPMMIFRRRHRLDVLCRPGHERHPCMCGGIFGLDHRCS
jgi:hypothetical protein